MYLHGQFIFGTLVSILCVVAQAVATVVVIRLTRRTSRHLSRRHPVATLILIMTTSGALLTATHFVEAGMWAGAYAAVSETRRADAYYLAFANFTTLGAAIEPDANWRLLGPMSAANGMLMFGWSTAVLFAVLLRTMATLRLR
jgi:hypothetical protein